MHKGADMSREIGIRELKNQASQVVRSVHEEMVEYVVTVRGKPVAVLRPFTEEDAEQWRQAEVRDAMAEMKSLAERVAEAWTSSQSGVELVEEQRR